MGVHPGADAPAGPPRSGLLDTPSSNPDRGPVTLTGAAAKRLRAKRAIVSAGKKRLTWGATRRKEGSL